LRGAGDAVSLSFEVTVRYAKTRETCEAYLPAHRLSEEASNKARRRAKRTSKRQTNLEEGWQDAQADDADVV
jgi:hypothetical protein